MPLGVSLLVRSAWIAVDELRRVFGRFETAEVLGEVAWRNATGRPFRGVEAPRDPREAATRKELAPAVNLYHVLRERLGPRQAYQIARRVILNTSLLHLRATYPDFGESSFLNLVGGGAEEASSRLATDFPFADTEVVEISRDRAYFDVTACRIPRVLDQVGASELAPVFCEVDELYFRIYEPAVALERKETILGGGSRCTFRRTWKRDQATESTSSG